MRENKCNTNIQVCTRKVTISQYISSEEILRCGGGIGGAEEVYEVSRRYRRRGGGIGGVEEVEEAWRRYRRRGGGIGGVENV